MIDDKITLAKIVDTITAIASGERNVNSVVVGDIYEMDARPDIKYCTFGLTQNEHTEDENFIMYDFNLFYIDRLTNDESSNEILIQSTSIQVLRNIVRKTCQYLDIDVYRQLVYYPFTQKFADLCAGAYVNVVFSVPLDMCAEDYGDSDDILSLQ